LVDGNEKLECFGIDIADFNTALVSEQDIIALTSRINADIVFGF
jgi:hypothetical protein